jgi:hypothetical protein
MTKGEAVILLIEVGVVALAALVSLFTGLRRP